MIGKKSNDIIKKIVELLANDKEIRTLLKDDKTTYDDVLKNKLIVSYPVILNDNTAANFISVHHDNTILASDNTYVTSFKISCGVSHDVWLTDNKDSRSLLLADRIEEILDGIRILDSTGELNLKTINSIFWNELVTGQSLIFQMVEMGDINEKKTIL